MGCSCVETGFTPSLDCERPPHTWSKGLQMADGVLVGTGYVTVEPDFSRFQEAVGRKLSAALAPQMQKVGSRAGKAIGDGVRRQGFGDALKPLLRRFESDSDKAGKAIASKIGQGSRKAKTDMFGLADAIGEVKRQSGKASGAAGGLKNDMFGVSRAAKASGRDIRSVSTQLDDWHISARRMASTSKGLLSRIRGLGYEFGDLAKGIRTSSGGFSGFDGVMVRVNRSAQFFRNILRTLRWPAFISGVGLAAQGLSALAAGAVAVTSALGPLTGLLVALPAAALAGAQAFGALKLATAGVGDAVNAAFALQVKGGTQAVDVLRQQEDAAEQVADAERSLANTQRQVKLAQVGLTEARKEARRELEDMRLAAEGAHDAEQQGAISLQRAQQELAKTLADPKASRLDIREAEEAVDQARSGLEQTRLDARRSREDYRDAQKKGVEGMTQVVSAKEAEADANRAVTDAERALTKAVRDQSDAMKDQGAAATALSQKMAELPPAAQKFARFLISLKPRFDQLREAAGQGFFPGATKGIKAALGNFKVLRGVVASTSSALGRLAEKAGRKLGSAAWGKDLARLGKLNTRIVGRLGDAGLHLADAFRHVLAAAEPFLDWLSKGTDKLAAWLAGEAEAGRESGRLAAFFDHTRETMELLCPILKGVGGALLNIGEAARPLGDEILDALGGATEGWREWTDSTRGKNRLKAYFAESKPAIFEMGKLIRDAGKAFFELGKQEGVAHLLRLVRTALIPAMRDLVGATTGWASGFLKQFQRLRKGGDDSFDAFLQTLVEHAGQAGWKIATALGRAFLNSNIWGKFAIAGFLLGKMGGLKAFGELGLKAGGKLGKALFTSAAKWIAGTETGASLLGWFQDIFGKGGRFAKLASTAGNRLGRIFGRGMVIGTVAGLVYFGPVIEDWIEEHVKDPIRRALDELPGDIGSKLLGAAELVNPANLGPVPTLLGVTGADVRDQLRSLVVPEPDTDKAEHGFERFRKRVGQEAQLTREAFKAQLGPLPGIAGTAGQGILRQMLPRLDALATGGGRKSEELKTNVGGNVRSLAKTVHTAMQNIGVTVGEMLKALGVPKPKGFNLQKALQSLPELPPLPGKQRGGSVKKALANGGLATTVPGNSTGDRHVLALNGRPVAKVESREGIFVGNRNLMATLEQRNREVPRFQTGGLVGQVQQLRRGGLVEPQLAGPAGALRDLGRAAIHKVFEGAKDFLAKEKPLGGAGGVGGLNVPTGPIQKMAREMVARLWGPGQWSAFNALEMAEAGWDPHATNPSSGAYGLPQALPASKLPPGAGPGSRLPLLEQAKLQLQWMMAYIKERYGSPSAAWSFHQANNWYREGGLVRAAKGMQMGGVLRDAAKGRPADRLRAARSSEFAQLLRRSSGAAKGTAARAVAWVKNNLGTPEGSAKQQAWGPDPWCGYFFGADMRAQGVPLPPNPGYTPSYEDEWGNGSTNAGGIGNAQPGDFLGYSGEHTAMYIGSGRAISGNYGDTVTEHSVGDPSHPLTSVRHPNYPGGSGAPGASDTSGAASQEPRREKIPASYRGAKTDPLNFGPMPRELGAVKAETKKLESWVKTYGAAKAHAEKHGKPETAEAIGRNLSKSEDRLAGLRRLGTRLRLEKIKKALKKRVGKAFGRFEAFDKVIGGSQISYEEAAQYAEQTVALEPQPPEVVQARGESDARFEKRREEADQAYVKDYKAYVEGNEGGAFQKVLARVADWRNNILRAERFGFKAGESGFKADQPSVLASENSWEATVRKARSRIEQINTFTKAVAERVATFRHDHKGQPLPKWLLAQIRGRDEMRKELPFLRDRDSQLSNAVLKARELFFPGGEHRLTELPLGKRVTLPLAGSGSLEEGLKEVQGIYSLNQFHELLSVDALAPPRAPGRFGGIVWQVQESIEELGLKIRQATSGLSTGGNQGDEEDSELVGLLREIAERERRGRLTSEILSSTTQPFEEAYGDLPRFHTGGIVPGPVTREVPAVLKGQERIRTPEQEAALASEIRGLGQPGAGDISVEVIVKGNIVSSEPDPVETVLRDSRTGRVIKRTSGGRPTAGGPRR